jgi:hypothetical protein
VRTVRVLQVTGLLGFKVVYRVASCGPVHKMCEMIDHSSDFSEDGCGMSASRWDVVARRPREAARFRCVQVP